jgi:hypothetical protein
MTCNIKVCTIKTKVMAFYGSELTRPKSIIDEEATEQIKKTAWYVVYRT